MPADELRPSGRIDLYEPGHRPDPAPPRRWVRPLLVVLSVTILGAGAFLARGPLSSAASSAWEAIDDWGSSLRDAAADQPATTTTTTLPPVEQVASAAVLVIVGDGSGGSAFALAVRSPEGGPELVMIPQALLVQVPGFGEFSVEDALMFGGPPLARLAIANEFGIRIDDLVTVPSGGLAAVADGFVVDVPVELYVEDPGGSRRLIAPGPQRVSSDIAELLLTEQGTGDLFDWLRRQEAVWEGALSAIAADAEAGARLAVTAGDSAAAADLLSVLASQPVIGAPPVDRVAVGASESALVLATDRIAGYLSDQLGHLLISPERRPRVEILNGNGVAGSTARIASTLVGQGFYVFRTGNADRFDYKQSRVIAQGEDASADAVRAAGVLGIEDVVLEARAPSGVVDLSIIVGTDLAPTED